MALLEDLKNKISSYANDKYEIEETSIIPNADYSKLTFGNKGLTSYFAFLYVDIRHSSKLQDQYGFEKSARIYQSFHEINVRVIIANAGSVRAFDGDRVMGVFDGDNKRTNAVKAAMQIQWAVRNILNIALKVDIKCGAGVDSGKTLVTKVGKGGSADNKDLVWVGKASNYAAHLANEALGTIIISTETYDNMASITKISKEKNMWAMKTLVLKNGNKVACYESTWSWAL